jgi:DinB superfamily
MPDPVTEFEEYRQELLGMLGGDEPIEVLRRTLHELQHSIEGVSETDLSRAPGPGEWSPRQVLSHLADSDLMVHVRVRMIVTQDRPQLVGYDQEAWAARFGNLLSGAEVVDWWRALRQANLRLFETLTPEEWQRVGMHTERGQESALLTVQMQAGHDRMHLDQLRRGLGLAGMAGA